MSSARNHAIRSHKTYKYHMAAARYYCNYSMTRAERLMMMSRLAAALQSTSTEKAEESTQTSV